MFSKITSVIAHYRKPVAKAYDSICSGPAYMPRTIYADFRGGRELTPQGIRLRELLQQYAAEQGGPRYDDENYPNTRSEADLPHEMYDLRFASLSNADERVLLERAGFRVISDRSIEDHLRTQIRRTKRKARMARKAVAFAARHPKQAARNTLKYLAELIAEYRKPAVVVMNGGDYDEEYCHYEDLGYRTVTPNSREGRIRRRLRFGFIAQ